jgi:hypothetical protein
MLRFGSGSILKLGNKKEIMERKRRWIPREIEKKIFRLRAPFIS